VIDEGNAAAAALETVQMKGADLIVLLTASLDLINDKAAYIDAWMEVRGP
jgi:hypothetical protein